MKLLLSWDAISQDLKSYVYLHVYISNWPHSLVLRHGFSVKPNHIYVNHMIDLTVLAISCPYLISMLIGSIRRWIILLYDYQAYYAKQYPTFEKRHKALILIVIHHKTLLCHYFYKEPIFGSDSQSKYPYLIMRIFRPKKCQSCISISNRLMVQIFFKIIMGNCGSIEAQQVTVPLPIRSQQVSPQVAHSTRDPQPPQTPKMSHPFPTDLQVQKESPKSGNLLGNHPQPQQVYLQVDHHKKDPRPHQLPPLAHHLPTDPQIDKQSSRPDHLLAINSQLQQHQNVSTKMARLASKLLEQFSICREISRLLQTVAHSSEQAANLASSIVNGLDSLGKQQSPASKEDINQFFTQEKCQLIKSEKLFYQGMEKELLKILNRKNLAQSSSSRIYHTIANIKKANRINIKEKNEFDITCIKINDYKELSAAEMDQVVKYQTVGEEILKLGEKLSFHFQSIKRESENITQLLMDCFNQAYSEILSSLKYDLSEQEVMKVATISREGCKAYDNGVYVLLVYFVKSVVNLQIHESSEMIQSKLAKAINLISEKYPPGKGLQQGQQHLQTALKNLVQAEDWSKVEFKHQIQKFKPQEKQKQVEQIVTRYAQIAQNNKGAFEELVKATCLQKGLSFKIGLKYYPEKPNPKALTRIKEKMFFGKNQSNKKDLSGTIKQVLEREEKEYLRKVDQLLEKRDEVQFKISDMVRGKCVFLKVEDIIETVNEIKHFVKKDSRFGIKEIESRFTNPIPISDVTLKIVINREIVAELQLTVQTNAAAYNFAHKIYELQRTKVFSKLKITHNYFEESQQEFKEQASTALRLMGSMPQAKSGQVFRGRAHLYFGLDSIQLQPFVKVLADTLEHKKVGVAQSNPAFDASLQGLMLSLLSIQMGEWDKSIGRSISSVLQDKRHSAKLKAVLLSFFFKKFDIFKQSQRMQQFCLNQQQEKEGKRYMEEYLRHYFGIDKAFEYLTQTHRVFHRGQQLLQLRFWKNYEDSAGSIQIGTNPFVEGCVEEDSSDKVGVIKEFLNFYFAVRNGVWDKFYAVFQRYYRWLQAIIRKNPLLDSEGMIVNEANVLEAQRFLQSGKLKEAENLLNLAVKSFKQKEQYGKALSCDLLLAECIIRSSNSSTPQDRIKPNQNVKERAKVYGLQLKGVLVASSKWRMAHHLLLLHKKGKPRQFFLETVASEALTQLSRSRGRQYVLAMKQIWADYSINQITQPKILENPSVTNLELINLNLQSEGCMYLAIAGWKNLSSLNFGMNSIGDVGCEHLSRAVWKNLTSLHLGYNHIGHGGCEHLSRADWKNLNSLDLRSNSIGHRGCEHLIRAAWKNLTSLQLGDNQIGHRGCEHLSRGDWKNLTLLNLLNNQIGDVGCQYLSKTDWKNLNSLYLGNNSIGDGGCEHLSKADWKNLISLNLRNNSIGDVGCEHLSRAEWKNLTLLNLNTNSIPFQHRQSLRSLFKQQSLQIDF